MLRRTFMKGSIATAAATSGLISTAAAQYNIPDRQLRVGAHRGAGALLPVAESGVENQQPFPVAVPFIFVFMLGHN